MVFLLRIVGFWLLRRFGSRAWQELRAGNVVGARRQLRRAGVVAVQIAGGVLLGSMLLFILLLVLLLRVLA